MGIDKYPFIHSPSVEGFPFLVILIGDLNGTGTEIRTKVLDCLMVSYQEALTDIRNILKYDCSLKYDCCYDYEIKARKIIEGVLYLLFKRGMLTVSVMQTTISDPISLWNFFFFPIGCEKLPRDEIYTLVYALLDNLFKNEKLTLLDKFLREMFDSNIFSPSDFEDIMGKVFRYFFIKSDKRVFFYFGVFYQLKYPKLRYPKWLSNMFQKTTTLVLTKYPRTGGHRMIYLMMHGVLPRGWQALGIITSEHYLEKYPKAGEVLYYAYKLVTSEAYLQEHNYDKQSFVLGYYQGSFKRIPPSILLYILSFLLKYY